MSAMDKVDHGVWQDQYDWKLAQWRRFHLTPGQLTVRKQPHM
jgi:hypothetical protein